MNEIGYCICARSGNYIATWINAPRRPQQIVVLTRVFLRNFPTTDRRVISGRHLAKTSQLEDLGFLVPPVETEATAYEYAVSA
ncbi:MULTISPECIES: hypothetical protein [Paenibacillus]|uniref:hypothetical protein n=1 Tax=Paenibacillus TaxID=44249 RepID=UPI00096BDB4D|nr:hypothetical protein [Paenibacillus odorifer]OME21569.1 hypothetical protein BSK57_19675 [Paenibacillus odorifer]